MIHLEITEKSYDILIRILRGRIAESEEELGAAVHDSDNGAIGDASAKIRLYESVLKECESFRHSSVGRADDC